MRGFCPICNKKKELAAEVLLGKEHPWPINICRGCWTRDMKPRMLRRQVEYVEA